MTKKLWMAAAMISIAAPLQAQPQGQNEEATSDNVSIAELERVIGGRTTVALKLKDATATEVTLAIGQASRLRFGSMAVQEPEKSSAAPAMQSPGHQIFETNFRQHLKKFVEDSRWSANLVEKEFWPLLRQWNLSNLPHTTPSNSGLPNSGLPNSGPTLSAFFETSDQLWHLVPSAELATGQAFNAWPCLVIATDFQRNQKLSLEASTSSTKPDSEAAAKSQAPAESQTRDSQTQIKRADEPKRVGNSSLQTSAQISSPSLKNGRLYDSLWLNLSVYLEPKLLKRAKIYVDVNEARDDQGEDLLPQSQASVLISTPTGFNPQSSRITRRVELRPRQATGSTLERLKGVISIRFPMQSEEREINNLDQAQNFVVNTRDFTAQAEIGTPFVKDGFLQFTDSAQIEAKEGWHKIREQYQTRKRRAGEGILGYKLMPQNYRFTDEQGRVWETQSKAGTSGFGGPSGEVIPDASPPSPSPDGIHYSEKNDHILYLASDPSDPTNAEANVRATTKLTPDELAKIRFTKITFTTESDWRTVEVPFEFYDLPLPPR